MAASRQRKIGVFLAIFGWALALGLTLYPTPDQAEMAASTGLWCLVCGEVGLVDVTLNLILFVPLGLGLGLLAVARSRAVLLIGLTTLTIEVLQLSVVTGRDASLSDLLTNLAGGLLGYLLARHWRGVLFPSPGRSVTVAAAGAFLWLGIQGLTGYAFTRTLPPSVYYGQWAAELGQFERFEGQVRAVHLDTIPLPGTRLARSDAVREALLDSTSVLDVKAVTGRPTADLAPIFSIFDDRQREILLLGQRDRDLVFRQRTRSGPLGLRGPSLLLPGVLPSAAGKPVELRASYAPGRYHLEAIVEGRAHSRELALSASWGWTLLLPFHHPFGREMPWLTTLWLGGILFPVGYYAGRSGRIAPVAFALGLGVVLVIGLVVIPAWFSLGGFRVTEWVAAIGGTVLGYRVGGGPRVARVTNQPGP